MKISWFWWYKHFHFVYILASVLLLSSIESSLSSTSSSSSTLAGGDEPTEEPEESYNSRSSRVYPAHAHVQTSNFSSTTTTAANISIHNDDSTNGNASSKKLDALLEDFHKRRNGDKQNEARAFGHGPGHAWNWKTAGRMVSRGLRMFRESLLEGAKVAHMFKEDIDEGMSSIMRQNRGVKADSPQSGQNKQTDKNSDSGSAGGSIFDSQMLREGVLGGILRFMGINSKQMGVIALNVLIIFAEWITSSMIGGGNEVGGATSRMIKSNLLQWANTGHNSHVEKILSTAKSHSLPEKLIDTLSEKTGNSTSCVQLLICKMTPVIRGFQDTVKDQLNTFGFQEETGWRTAPKTTSSSTTTTTTPSSSTGGNSSTFPYEHDDEIPLESRGFLGTSQYLLDKFLVHLPPTERMLDFGDRCEAKFPQCKLLKFSSAAH